jgi:hypothetical protein
MKIEGIYFSEYYWPRYNTLWAYRFYPDGVLLFTYADPVGRFFLHTEAGTAVCQPKDILGNKSKLPDFFRCFARELPIQIAYRSGLPAVTQGNFVTDGANISISHPYFHYSNYEFAGQVLPDRLILSPVESPVTTTGQKKPATTQTQIFLRLDLPCA